MQQTEDYHCELRCRISRALSCTAPEFEYMQEWVYKVEADGDVEHTKKYLKISGAFLTEGNSPNAEKILRPCDFETLLNDSSYFDDLLAVREKVSVGWLTKPHFDEFLDICCASPEWKVIQSMKKLIDDHDEFDY